MSLHQRLSEADKAAIGEADTKAFGLKPCPFPHCGSRRLYLGRTRQKGYCVECLDCGGRSIETETLEAALEQWGRITPTRKTAAIATVAA